MSFDHLAPKNVMLPVEEAVQRVLAAFAQGPAEWVALANARGRVLAEDLQAPRDQPHEDMAAMDGYAVRAADLASGEATLDLVGIAPAGGRFDRAIEAGETVRILTGGPLPKGADAVALQENARIENGRVHLTGHVAPGRFVRHRGLNMRAGDIVLPAGKALSPRDLGLAASIGAPWLKVRRKPRIGLLATGDELIRPGEPWSENKIITSNTVVLAALAEAFGAEALDLGIVEDRAESFVEALCDLRAVDLLVTMGGASVGDRDLVRDVLVRHGLTLDFWKIAMRPGKPVMFGRLDQIPLLALPGNPVSAAVCALIFMRPVILRLIGQDPALPEVPAVLGEPLGPNDEREEFLRAKVSWTDDGRLEARPAKRQDSAMFAIFAGADCLIRRPAHAPAAPSGTMVRIVPLNALGLDI